MTEPLPPHPRPEFLARQQRVIDQMISMHAALRDRATRIATTITVVLLSGSTVSAALAFAGTDTALQLVRVTLTRSTWLGIFSVVVFIGTLVELVTDHRGIARQHRDAVRLLADLKSQHQRALPDADDDWSSITTTLSARYGDVMAQIPPIPESRFNDLKARHLRKVEISKLLSATPGLTERQARRRLATSIRTTAPTAVGTSTPQAD